MDIIAAHQQGLIEQLEDDVRALAGRTRDHCQRAVVLHHLYDHSRGAHEWALAEALREMRIARALATLKKWLDRWGWIVARRDEARSALARLGDATGKASQARCAAVYRSYRLTASAALQGEAEQSLPADLIALLRQCHGARLSGNIDGREALRALWDCTEQLAASAVDQSDLAAAWAAIDATGLRRLARKLLGKRAIERSSARDRKRGWARMERALRADPLLPTSFRANPAQHFYALQYALAERRRQQWREACDREAGAFGIAA